MKNFGEKTKRWFKSLFVQTDGNEPKMLTLSKRRHADGNFVDIVRASRDIPRISHSRLYQCRKRRQGNGNDTQKLWILYQSRKAIILFRLDTGEIRAAYYVRTFGNVCI